MLRRLRAPILFAVVAFVVGLAGHAGWFLRRVATGEVTVDLGGVSPLVLYLSSHDVLEGLVVGVVCAGFAVILGRLLGRSEAS